jgi:cell division septation protein DedD
MAKTTKNSSRQPSLEELLRFKKAEKPTEAFWGRFDDELHQRMMQTLVKKDHWLVQITRGLTGRIAQTTALAGAAALIALMVIRPAITDSGHSTQPAVAQVEVPADKSDPQTEVSEPRFFNADYGIDVVSVADLKSKSGVSHEFEMDRIQVARYDLESYSVDRAAAGVPSIASAGASFVF